MIDSRNIGLNGSGLVFYTELYFFLLRQQLGRPQLTLKYSCQRLGAHIQLEVTLSNAVHLEHYHYVFLQ